MHNQAILIGRLGRDPETRRTGAGDPVVNLRLCTSRTWKDKATGERKEKAEWHQIVIYNENLGRIAEQYLRKGSVVHIQGEISTRKWTDQAGVEKYTTEIVLGRFDGTLTLLPNGGERQAPSQDDYGTTRTREGSTGGPASGGGKPAYDLDDDIPF